MRMIIRLSCVFVYIISEEKEKDERNNVSTQRVAFVYISKLFSYPATAEFRSRLSFNKCKPIDKCILQPCGEAQMSPLAVGTLLIHTLFCNSINQNPKIENGDKSLAIIFYRLHLFTMVLILARMGISVYFSVPHPE